MAAAQRGDASAYEQLLGELLPEVRRIVRGRLFDTSSVDDAVQNALLALHRARSTYRPERPFGPWMRAIVRNSTIDFYRQATRRRKREIGGDLIDFAEDPKPARERLNRELSGELSQALAEIPEKQREAVEMVQLEGLSVAEAALRAGVSVSALKVRAHRGYRALRALLDGGTS